MLGVADLTVSRFKGSDILSKVSFELEKGQILSVFGPSGCGKSTLLNAIAGFIPFRDAGPEERRWRPFQRWTDGMEQLRATGRIAIAGEDVTGLPPEARPVGLVLQRYGVYPHLTSFANIAFPLTCRGTPEELVEPIVLASAAMAAVDAGLLPQKVKTLSGGEAQRVAIAKMLAKGARVALLDEPFSHLDQLRRNELASLIRKLVGSSEDGAMDTLVLISHDWRELHIADKAMLLNARADGQRSCRLFTRSGEAGEFDFSIELTDLPPDDLENRWIDGLRSAASRP